MDITRQQLLFLSAQRILGKDGKYCNYEHEPRPNFAIAFVEHGWVEFFENGKTMILKPGCFSYVPVGARYQSRWHDAVQMVSVAFNFAPTALPFAGRRYDVQILTGSNRLREHMREILALQNSPERCMTLLMHFYAMIDEAYTYITGTGSTTPDPRILQAVEYFDSGAMPPLSMDELAAKCTLSNSHFFSLFKRTTGMTPVEYKNKAAINRAEQLLLSDPQLSVEEISELTGFSTSSYFRRVFAEITGMSPRAYRKNASI